MTGLRQEGDFKTGSNRAPSEDAAAVRNILRDARARGRAEARAALKGKDPLDVLKYAAGEMEKDVRSREERRGR